MGTLGAVLRHPDDFYPLLNLKMAVHNAAKQIPPEPHWAFCYTMLQKVSRSFALVIQQLDTDLRNARMIQASQQRSRCLFSWLFIVMCMIVTGIFHAVQSITKFSWTSFIMFQLLFLSLEGIIRNQLRILPKKWVQEWQNLFARRFVNHIETIDDYDEYCHYVAGLVGLGLSKLFHASGKEDMVPDDLSNSMGLFLQKANIIRDYLEDINEIPKSRMFWPCEIWNKYVNKLEDLKYEENLVKAVECLNDMVTNALTHVQDCFKYMSVLRNPAIFRFCAIPQVMAIGTLALCYNNIEVFRGVVKMRRGLTAKVIDRTNKMSDVYGAFYDFSCILKSKIKKNDPNATKTLSQINAIQKICIDSGVLGRRKSYIIQNGPKYNSTMIVLLFVILAIIFSYLSANRATN
ncbi:squalene synthase 3-like isoform X3 [Mangifera indica]|uniref:squalene synthase 3-like isoform X3 n=1 Tax=Mangifera indica TaxID=29780 RepID=UPI001CF9E788|nr:squalene synthase 3-like isoform X3 [Mangifera indica]